MIRSTTALSTATCLLLAGLGTLGLPAQAATPKATATATSAPASERDPDALAALEGMGAALRALNQFSLTSDASTEVVLEDGQKIELDGKVSYRVKRPNQVFVALDSDRQQRQLIYDGKALTVYAPKLKYYAQVDGLHATLGELVEQAATRYDIEFPLADMFLWGTDKAPSSLIRSARHIGGGTQDGQPIEQYAFQQDGVDWQVWISKASSLPVKLIINSLDDPAQPQYRARLRWDTRTPVPDSAFVFTPPADAHRIKLVPVAVAVVAPDAEN
ncbi:DUF2092 domain-containing protein [Stenotrophomonas oahuensis]|uniref:DUF2092 domain-containing protein n=1 Tax=Stenotrophomonas oahuensis TaxID=3003271 RepID=A0ABY9YQ36_9GAMM|nr:DUF2092 domain-containing protein [Stenotrophomonas sp. A5586]WNH52334.1 DUF2092 domain-containing protein [Stenotrophomonas sp. A5586]